MKKVWALVSVYAGLATLAGSCQARTEKNAASAPVCAPGTTQECVCTTAQSGAQSCNDEGSAWRECECTAPPVPQLPSELHVKRLVLDGEKGRQRAVLDTVGGPALGDTDASRSTQGERMAGEAIRREFPPKTSRQKSSETEKPKIALANVPEQMRWVKRGQTLQDPTIGEWKAAARKDKVVTAGAWLMVTTWRGHVKVPADFGRLKIKAESLADAIDTAVSDIRADGEMAGMKINEIAVSLIAISGDTGP